MENRKIGTVEKWKGKFGFIFVTNMERYFLPISQFDMAREPIVGEQVSFEADPAPTIPGLPANKNLPVAKSVRPIADLPAEKSEGGVS